MKKNRHWIQMRLKELGRTQRGLAEAIGVGRAPTITDIIKGDRKLYANEAILMANYLDVSVEELMKHIPGQPQKILENLMKIKGTKQNESIDKNTLSLAMDVAMHAAGEVDKMLMGEEDAKKITATDIIDCTLELYGIAKEQENSGEPIAIDKSIAKRLLNHLIKFR